MRLRFFLDLGDFSEKTVNLVTQILGFSEILIIIGSEYIPSTSIFWKKSLAFAKTTIYIKSYMCSKREMDFDFNQMVVT